MNRNLTWKRCGLSSFFHGEELVSHLEKLTKELDEDAKVEPEDGSLLR